MHLSPRNATTAPASARPRSARGTRKTDPPSAQSLLPSPASGRAARHSAPHPATVPPDHRCASCCPSPAESPDGHSPTVRRPPHPPPPYPPPPPHLPLPL